MSFTTEIHKITIRQEVDVVKYWIDFSFTNNYPFDVQGVVGQQNWYGLFITQFNDGISNSITGGFQNFYWPDSIIRAGETVRFNDPEAFFVVPFNLQGLDFGLYNKPKDFLFVFSSVRDVNDQTTVLEGTSTASLNAVPIEYYGCTDSSSINYNPSADIDNGSCRNFFTHPDSYYEDLTIEANNPKASVGPSQVTQSLNTSLRATLLIGETLSGPAFLPTGISNWGEYKKVFGGTAPDKLGDKLKFPLPYYAQSYLEEGDNLIVQRVLGKGGYDAGPAFTLLSAPFALNGLEGNLNNDFFGDQEVYFAGFPGIAQDVKQVLGVLRSRATYRADGSLEFRAQSISLSSISSDIYAVFRLNVGLANGKVESYEVSLNPLHKLYINKVLGTAPSDKPAAIYVDALYDNLVKEISTFTRLAEIRQVDSPIYRNMGIGTGKGYTHAVTPWIVSEVRGNNIDRLFRFVSQSSGVAANDQFKISITNIDPENGEFDVLIRDYRDKDDKVRVLESFRGLSLDPGRSNYILKAIGDLAGEYDRKSDYVIVEMDRQAPVGSVPAGFEGYYVRNFMALDTIGNAAEKISPLRNPSPIYKRQYLENDRIGRTYLGLSDKQGYDESFFTYFGDRDNETVKTYGFHLEEGAGDGFNGGHFNTVGKFHTGKGSLSVSELGDQTNPYHLKNTRKFTVFVAGGFDGWDEHREKRTTAVRYMQSRADGFAHSDYYAYQQALDGIANPDNLAYAVLSTPNINFVDDESLVSQFLDIVENRRGDALYLIEAPEYDASPGSVDAFLGDLDRVRFDSSYAAAYFPHLKIRDNLSGKNLWVSPNMAVIKSLAYTDISQRPWFAAAGMDRGITGALGVKYVLSEEERDRLNEISANAVMQRNGQQVVIWGNRTLLNDGEKATSDLNVRRLLLEAQQYVKNIAMPLLFEQNDNRTRQIFEKKMNNLIQFLKDERGVYDARFTLESTVDENRLSGMLALKPTRVLEYIDIAYNIIPTGVSFDEV